MVFRDPRGENAAVPDAAQKTPTRAISELRLWPGDRIGVACSGGLDSTVLLHLALARARQAGIPVIAVHVQHGIRGRESTGDERFVRALARSRGIPCRVARVRIDPKRPGSLEARARAARYQAFERIALKERLTLLLLAHHADDQAETIVMRILRGTDARDMRGIPRERPLSRVCRIVRPLLDVPRAALLALARRRGGTWREDSSNQDLRIARNRVRHRILPALRERIPDVDEYLRRISALGESQEAALLKAVWTVPDAAIAFVTSGLFAFDAATLALLHPEVRLAFFRTCLRFRAGGATLPRCDASVIESLLSRSHGSCSASLSGIGPVRREGPWLWIGDPSPPVTPVRLRTGDSLHWRPIECALEARILRSRSTITRALRRARADPGVAVLDDREIRGPLMVRVRSEGDRYRPLGAPGRRLISDMMSERGIPGPLRDRWPLVCDREGILWAPLLPPAERGRVGPASTRGMEISWIPIPPLIRDLGGRGLPN